MRRDLYPDYKAGRAEKDPELVDQLDRAGALLDALGLATLTPPGLEADDVNASGATWAERPRLELRDHHLRPRRLRPHQRPHAGAAPHRRRDQRLAAAQPRDACTPCTASRADQLPGVRRAARRRSDNLPGVIGHRREDRRDPARRRPARWTRSGPTSTTTTARSLVAALDDWAAETGARRVGATVVRRLSRARRPRALRLQRADDVRARRPRPRPDPRRPRHARAAAARPRPGRPGWSASSTSTSPPTSRCGC